MDCYIAISLYLCIVVIPVKSMLSSALESQPLSSYLLIFFYLTYPAIPLASHTHINNDNNDNITRLTNTLTPPPLLSNCTVGDDKAALDIISSLHQSDVAVFDACVESLRKKVGDAIVRVDRVPAYAQIVMSVDSDFVQVS